MHPRPSTRHDLSQTLYVSSIYTSVKSLNDTIFKKSQLFKMPMLTTAIMCDYLVACVNNTLEMQGEVLEAKS
jgi:hypothetical protein